MPPGTLLPPGRPTRHAAREIKRPMARTIRFSTPGSGLTYKSLWGRLLFSRTAWVRKGHASREVARQYSLLHVSTGHAIREHITQKTALGQDHPRRYPSWR